MKQRESVGGETQRGHRDHSTITHDAIGTELNPPARVTTEAAREGEGVVTHSRAVSLQEDEPSLQLSVVSNEQGSEPTSASS